MIPTLSRRMIVPLVVALAATFAWTASSDAQYGRPGARDSQSILPNRAPVKSAYSMPLDEPDRPAPARIAAKIAELGRAFGPGVSISVRDIREGWSTSWNGDRLCPWRAAPR
jgi:hypothetical protein